MTDKTEMQQLDPQAGAEPQPALRAPAPLSRRALLRGATVAVPAVLTLNSQAAMGWAITSNTIGTRGLNGRTEKVYCLEDKDLYEVKPGVYDLGSPPDGDAYEVPDTVKFKRKDYCGDDYQLTTPEKVCYKGGYVKYDDGSGWKYLGGSSYDCKYKVRPRPLISNAAFSSFAQNIYVKSYKNL